MGQDDNIFYNGSVVYHANAYYFYFLTSTNKNPLTPKEKAIFPQNTKEMFHTVSKLKDFASVSAAAALRLAPQQEKAKPL